MRNGKVFIIGVAGFIGSFLMEELQEGTDDVIVGFGNVSSYYDLAIKEARLAILTESNADGRFTIVHGDLCGHAGAWTRLRLQAGHAAGGRSSILR